MTLKELSKIQTQINKHLRLAVEAKAKADFYFQQANQLTFQLREFLNSGKS